MYLIIHGDNINTNPYALLTVAEYYQCEKRNLTKAIQCYIQLYRNGDPQVREKEKNLNIIFMNLFRVYIIQLKQKKKNRK